MKDSGVEWIGEIPEHWKISRLKHFTTKIGSGITPHGGSEVYVEKGVPLIRSQNVHFAGLLLDDVVYITPEIHEEMRNTKLRPHDVLLNITGASIGRCTYVPDNFVEGNVNQHVCIIRTDDELHYRYVSFFISSTQIQTLVNAMQVGASRQGLTYEDIGSFDTIIPPIIEQKQIADFLDKETSKIDLEMRKNQKLIELLKEKRQATINQAITKGLDPTVPMKDSGVEWIGKIPEHWRILSLKNTCLLITDGSHFSPTPLDEGYPIATVENMDGNRIDIKSCRKISKSDYDSLVMSNCQPRLGDVLFSKDGTIGLSLVYRQKDPIVVLSSIAIIKPKEVLNSSFCNHQLQSNIIQVQIDQYIGGAALKRLVLGDIRNFHVCIPVILEQKQIADFLDKETSKIDSLISKTQKQIQKLQEYRQTLISEAVTGKIDLRKEITA